MTLQDFVRGLPKAELHVHIEGHAVALIAAADVHEHNIGVEAEYGAARFG